MDEYQPRGPSMTIPAAIGALAMGGLGGLAIGYAAHAMFIEPEIVIPPAQVIKDEMTDDELIEICAEITADDKEALQQAHHRVESLQAEIDAKEAEIAKYEARKEQGAKQYKAMKDEVAMLRIQLANAEQERDEALVELKSTIKQLEVEITEKKKAQKLAKKYKYESTQNLWSAFSTNAKVEICDRGTRKRHDKCHESVDAAMARYQSKFTECVDTYQAVPVLKQGEKGAKLPAFAEWVNDEDKFTKKGWYIIFCDPTLPEAEDPTAAFDVEGPVDDGNLNADPDRAPAVRADQDLDVFDIDGKDAEETLDDFDLDLK